MATRSESTTPLGYTAARYRHITLGGLLRSIVLIHWNVTEGRQRARQLRQTGYRVQLHTERGSAAFRKYRSEPPEAFVIDLTRLPSEGSGTAQWLRQQKALQQVPLVLLGAPDEKEQHLRKLLPDANYAPWSRFRSTLKLALRATIHNPVIPPDPMAGYSGTPLPRKLGIKESSRVGLLGAPRDFGMTLGALPDTVQLRWQARGTVDLVLLFARSRAELGKRFPAATRMVAPGGSLWILWPKKASGVTTDLSQNDVRSHGLDANWVDFKICAVDATWSGLRFARRKRSGE